MANQLTSSGLTVGSGTIANFIPAFGSNVVGTGSVTVTVPSSDRAMPSSPAVGTVYAFNVTSYNKSVTLPSAGTYCYKVTTAASGEDYPSGSSVSGNQYILPNSVTSGGTVIASNSTAYKYLRAGGGTRPSQLALVSSLKEVA